jgi:hypothetical protein
MDPMMSRKVTVALSCVFLLATVLTLPIYLNDLFLSSAKMVEDDVSCACILERTGADDFERPLRYVKGDFKGQCIDSCKYRHSEILKLSADKTTLFVSNVLHDNRFWVAKIEVQSLHHVDFLFEEFAPGINHIALEFSFEKGNHVNLFSQAEGQVSNRKVKIHSLVVSPEAARPGDKKYSLWDGMVGNYALMNRLMTKRAYDDSIQETKHPLRKYRAKMDTKEVARLFLKMTMDSQLVYNNQYQLLFNNCATTVVDTTLFAKDLLLSSDWDRWDILDPLRGVPSSYSLGTIRTLQWWNLLDENRASTMSLDQ